MITVKCFAQIRELCGTDQLALPATGITTVAEALAQLRARSEAWQQALAGEVLIAVNQTLADAKQPLRDGDELALFPPVTGG